LRRTIVQKVHAVKYLLPARTFLQLPKLLQLPLFFPLFAPLVDALAFFEGFPLFLPHALLVLEEVGMPGFFEIKVLQSVSMVRMDVGEEGGRLTPPILMRARVDCYVGFGGV
jgi:hypothetical protein